MSPTIQAVAEKPQVLGKLRRAVQSGLSSHTDHSVLSVGKMRNPVWRSSRVSI